MYEKTKSAHMFLQTFSIDSDEIDCVATIYWFVETYAKFTSHE